MTCRALCSGNKTICNAASQKTLLSSSRFSGSLVVLQRDKPEGSLVLTRWQGGSGASRDPQQYELHGSHEVSSAAPGQAMALAFCECACVECA